MKISQIIGQLHALLPIYTGRFSDQIAFSGIVIAGGVATVTTTSAHGLATGAAVTLSGVQTLTAISGASLVGTTLTLTTGADHDLTLGWPEHANVTMSGFTNANLNGSFTLLASDNRRTFEILTAEAVPTLNGGELLHEVRAGGLNGRHSITVTTTTGFTFPVTIPDQTATGGTLSTGVRVTGSATLERAVDQFTAQGSGKLWGFVIPGNALVSKSRQADSDALSTATGAEDVRIRLVDPFDLVVFVPVKQDIAGVAAMDITRDEILQPILKSLFGATLDTGVAESGKIKVAFRGHGPIGYSGGGYLHRYSFELPFDITADDAVDPLDTAAFRDIPLTIEVGDGASIDINLDIDPL